MSIAIQTVPCGMIQANAYIVQAEGRDDCVVVDPGEEFPKLMRAVGERRVGAILLTHGHFDHTQAAATLSRATGAPVYVRPEDIEMLNDAWLNGYAGLMGRERMDGPDIAAQPLGNALAACGLEFSVLPTPGHSKGSACLYLPAEGALFSGDTLFRAGYGRVDLHGGNLRQLIASLRRLFELPGETRVYPGHGGATTIAAEKARYSL